MGKPLCKNVNFWTFWTCCFYSLERRFFVLEYRKKIFLPYIAKEKKVGKMAIFGPKPWVNPLQKKSIFSFFWTSCFYRVEKRLFVLEYDKRHFPGLYCLKKKFGKMAIFGPKPRVKTLWKMWIFRLFRLIVFIA